MLNKILENIDKDNKNLLGNKIIIISAKVDMAQNKFNHILPKRLKRGLINGLGTIIKDITGNLDNDDLKDIQRALDQIQTGQNDLIQNSNKQIKINEQLASRIELQNKNFQINLNVINDTINKILNKVNGYTAFIITDSQLYRLEYIISELNNQLDNLLDILAFSRNQLISRHLLNEEELKFVITTIDQNHVVIPHELAILNLLKVKGIINQNNLLIYIINIPIFNPMTFQLYQLITINIQNKILFPTPPNHIILNDNQYMEYNPNQCQVIYGIYYCQQTSILPNQNTCIPAIVTQQKAICNHTTTTPVEQIIQLDEKSLFVSPKPGTTLEFNSNCSRNTNRINTETILEYSCCYVQVNGKIYSNNNNVTFQYELRHLPWNEVEIQRIIPNMNIHDISNWTVDNLKELQEKHIIYQYHHATQYSLLTIIIMITIILYFINKYKPNWMRKLTKSVRLQVRGEESRNDPDDVICHDDVTPQPPKCMGKIPIL